MITVIIVISIPKIMPHMFYNQLAQQYVLISDLWLHYYWNQQQGYPYPDGL